MHNRILTLLAVASCSAVVSVCLSRHEYTEAIAWAWVAVLSTRWEATDA